MKRHEGLRAVGPKGGAPQKVSAASEVEPSSIRGVPGSRGSAPPQKVAAANAVAPTSIRQISGSFGSEPFSAKSHENPDQPSMQNAGGRPTGAPPAADRRLPPRRPARFGVMAVGIALALAGVVLFATRDLLFVWIGGFLFLGAFAALKNSLPESKGAWALRVHHELLGTVPPDAEIVIPHTDNLVESGANFLSGVGHILATGALLFGGWIVLTMIISFFLVGRMGSEGLVVGAVASALLILAFGAKDLVRGTRRDHERGKRERSREISDWRKKRRREQMAYAALRAKWRSPGYQGPVPLWFKGRRGRDR